MKLCKILCFSEKHSFKVEVFGTPVCSTSCSTKGGREPHFFAFWEKIKNPDFHWKSGFYVVLLFFSVVPPGLFSVHSNRSDYPQIRIKKHHRAHFLLISRLAPTICCQMLPRYFLLIFNGIIPLFWGATKKYIFLLDTDFFKEYLQLLSIRHIASVHK